MLELTISVIELLAVMVASGAAVYGVRSWRKEVIGRRQTELAEDVLAAAYEVEAVYGWVRSPMSYASEGETRPNREKDPRDVKRRRDSYFVPIHRLNKDRESLVRLRSLRYRAKAIFGIEIDRSIGSLFQVANTITVAAKMLDDYVNIPPIDESGRELKIKMEREIGWGVSREDHLGREITAAISEIEAICNKHISV